MGADEQHWKEYGRKPTMQQAVLHDAVRAARRLNIFSIKPLLLQLYWLHVRTAWPSSLSSDGVHAASNTASRYQLLHGLPAAAAAAAAARCAFLLAAVKGLPSTQRSTRDGK